MIGDGVLAIIGVGVLAMNGDGVLTMLGGVCELVVYWVNDEGSPVSILAVCKNWLTCW